MHQLAVSSLDYANGYYKALKNSIDSEKARFNNELLYQMVVMCYEKYLVSLLARYEWAATHHMPMALFREAKQFEPMLTDEMKKTAILIGKFESICSLDGFGYGTPTKEELKQMINGIGEVKTIAETRIQEIN